MLVEQTCILSIHGSSICKAAHHTHHMIEIRRLYCLIRSADNVHSEGIIIVDENPQSLRNQSTFCDSLSTMRSVQALSQPIALALTPSFC